MSQGEDRLRTPLEIVESLGLDFGSGLEEIAAAVAGLYGKRLVFEGLEDSGWGALTGMWVDQPHQGLIFYRKADPEAYQVHCILHEFGHVLLGQYWCGASDKMSRALFGGVPVFARTVDVLASAAQDDEVERAAEEIAFLLAERLHSRPRDPFERVFG